MKTQTELGTASKVSEEMDRQSGIWRTRYELSYELNIKGVEAMNFAADDTGGIELVLFDSDRRNLLTIVVSKDVNPVESLRVFWKNFRKRISASEFKLVGKGANAIAVNSEDLMNHE